MIPLSNNSSTTTQVLQVALGGSATTTYPTCTVCSYIVPRQAKTVSGANGSIAGDPSEYQSAPEFTLLTGSAAATISAAPPTGSTKDIHNICIYNADTASATVTVSILDNATTRVLKKVVLLTLESLNYDNGRGWYCMDANGNIKESLSAASNWAISGNLTVAGNTTLGDAAGDSLTVNAGTYSAPNLPCFLAYNSTTRTNQTGNGATATVTFDSERFDQGNNFASNTFTAPTTGRYLLTATVRMSALTAAMTDYQIDLVTSNVTYRIVNDVTPVAADILAMTVTAVADMDAADTATVTLTISNGVGNTASITGSSTQITYFSGVQVA